jgi:hypothetical protein
MRALSTIHDSTGRSLVGEINPRDTVSMVRIQSDPGIKWLESGSLSEHRRLDHTVNTEPFCNTINTKKSRTRTVLYI